MQGQYILEGMLNALIQMEDAGDALYKELSEKVEDPDVSRIMETLANQELHHKRMYESYKLILKPHEDIDDVKIAYLETLINNTVSFLSDTEIPDSVEDAIAKAAKFEEDTIHFLTEMKTLIYPKFHSEIDVLIGEEKKHLEYLKKIN